MSSVTKFVGLFILLAIIVGSGVVVMENSRQAAMLKVEQEEIAVLSDGKIPAKMVSSRATAQGIGDTAKEIKLNNPEGKEISLSSLRGKYVLIDFWASWCGPCRKENPALVKTYLKYRNLLIKNKYEFTIFSVSLDSKVDTWKAAITKDQLEWPYHVSNLAGWGCKTAEAYGVAQLPSNFLIDNNGKILKIDLRGDDLDKALAEIK